MLDQIRAGGGDDEPLRNLDTGRPISEVRDRLVTANAYLGSRPIAEALAQGADLVITGRVADPSLTVGPCAHWFGWSWDDWDCLAGATVAGHLIECGTQAHRRHRDRLAGNARGRPHWLSRSPKSMPTGAASSPSLRGTGGIVCEATVKEQLLYEIGDPGAYLSPDVTLSLLGLEVDQLRRESCRYSRRGGGPRPPTYKVSATYQDGFWAARRIDGLRRRRLCEGPPRGRSGPGAIRGRRGFLSRIAGRMSWRRARACPMGIDPASAYQIAEVVLRIAVADGSHEALERFARELMPLVTAGPPGTTGYAAGRPRDPSAVSLLAVPDRAGAGAAARCS